ncbi:uncharacterized protein LOC118467607 isoform X1 [Anopheles albimanus]|uniref:uncharacterized protein LOC118467607 isoform X1 n=1 Tax=Anopheles albimanus TaxID=7167 RepID=UPI00164160C7|nr:uncharacterized protein LOC118467607 isoform X1 [Anopheles albimanus]
MNPIDSSLVVLLIVCISTIFDQAGAVQENSTHEVALPAKPHNGHQLLCHVCWSTVSTVNCQNVSKSEPCTPTGMETVVGKLAPQNVSSSPTELTLPGGAAGSKQDAVRYRCFTLTYTAPTTAEADHQSAIYAKGCTTISFDPCAGLQGGNASCTFCAGNNCNAAASDKKMIAARSKATATVTSSSSCWLLAMALIVMMVVSPECSATDAVA